MKSPARILFIFAPSLTEARGLLPVLREVEKEPRISLTCLTAAHLADDFRLSLTHKLLKAQGISYSTAGRDAPLSAKRILAKFTPQVIVLGNDNTIINRFIVYAAAARGVPTVLIQEGLLNYIPLVPSKRSARWLLTHLKTVFFLSRAYLANGAVGEWAKALFKTLLRQPIGNRAYGFNRVSLFCVLSEYDAENFRKNGSAAQRLVPTGIPSLADLGAGKSYQSENKREYDFVLFTTCEDQWLMTSEAQLEVYRDIVAAIQQVKPNARIGIKFHQSEDRRKFMNLKRVEVIETLDMAFSRGRVMVGTNTTVLLQAMLLGFPTVSYLPEEFHYQWLESFLTNACRQLNILAKDKSSLVAILRRSLAGLEQEPLMASFRDFWNKRLHNSAGAIKNLIMDLCHDHLYPF